jgi:hypothetical protein
MISYGSTTTVLPEVHVHVSFSVVVLPFNIVRRHLTSYVGVQLYMYNAVRVLRTIKKVYVLSYFRTFVRVQRCTAVHDYNVTVRLVCVQLYMHVHIQYEDRYEDR